jgi:autotransporter-associated beta strand protein
LDRRTFLRWSARVPAVVGGPAAVLGVPAWAEETAFIAARGGFCANDGWHNDIGGDGGLVKAGTGTLTLTGRNSYRGGTRVEAGTLVAAAPDALGPGDVGLAGGTLRVSGLRAGGYHQTGGTLSVGPGPGLLVRGEATLERGSVLEIRLTGSCPAHEVEVLRARRLRGRFSAIEVDHPGHRAVARYTSTGLSVRILREFS